MNNFRFVPQVFGGAILLPMSKIAPPNGSGTQDAAGKAIADQCRHVLICFPNLENTTPVRSCVLEKDPRTDTTAMDLLAHFSDCFCLF